MSSAAPAPLPVNAAPPADKLTPLSSRAQLSRLIAMSLALVATELVAAVVLFARHDGRDAFPKIFDLFADTRSSMADLVVLALVKVRG
ncbi:hypothetical protein T492DRAFT_858265 [Pavlovales sp. CCMP2436]|nr:hypothetical protein T492DRAFT_858265 [Pavlovales sp. CCMP2436]